MHILAAVPGADPDRVRRLIREVCAKWTGPNGKTKSRQHVVDEVIRLLAALDEKGQAEIPRETIVVSKPSNSAKEEPPERPRRPFLRAKSTARQV